MAYYESELEYFSAECGYDASLFKEGLFKVFMVAVHRPGSWEGEAVRNLLNLINSEDWERYEKKEDDE